MSQEYPLFPHLSEEGAKEAERVIEHAKKRLKAVLDEALGEIYMDIPAHIEGDSWQNFRNDLMAGFKNYGNRKIQGDYDFAAIREQIYCDFRDEIIKDVDQDHLKRIESLQQDNQRLRDMLESARGRSW